MTGPSYMWPQTCSHLIYACMLTGVYQVVRMFSPCYFHVSRHTVVCRAAQVAGAPHREYIYRKKVNAIFTPL